MRVALLTDKGSRADALLEKLGDRLCREVAGLEVARETVDGVWDLPLCALRHAADADLVVVLVRARGHARLERVLEKLVDVELQTGTPVLKAVEEGRREEARSDEEAADAWAAAVLARLFGEEDGQAPEEDSLPPPLPLVP